MFGNKYYKVHQQHLIFSEHLSKNRRRERPVTSVPFQKTTFVRFYVKVVQQQHEREGGWCQYRQNTYFSTWKWYYKRKFKTRKRITSFVIAALVIRLSRVECYRSKFERMPVSFSFFTLFFHHTKVLV